MAKIHGMSGGTLRVRPVIPPASIRLGWAVLCPDCEVIFDSRQPTCPQCAGESRMPLQTWLDQTRRDG